MSNQRQYRGISKKTGKWVYGWYFHLHNSAIQGDGIKEGDWESCEHDIHGIFDIDSGLLDPVDWEGTIHRASYREVIPETAGQSTGLKDKNDIEEYFDDIVRWNGKLWVIVWSVTLAGIQLQPLANFEKCQSDIKVKRLFGPSFGIGQAKYSEHIGTIHDHLLKGAEHD